MSLALVKHERVVRLLPGLSLLALLFGGYLSWPLRALLEAGDPFATGPPQRQEGGLLYLLFSIPVVQALGITLMFLPLRERVRPHERALPLTLRDLVLVRVVAGWLGVLVPTAIVTLVFLVRLSPHLSRVAEPARVLAAAGTAAAACALAVLIAFAWRPRAATLRIWEVVGLVVVGAGLLLLPELLADLRLGIAYAVVVAGLAAWLWRSLPAAPPEEAPVVGRPEPSESGPVASEPGAAALLSPLRWTLLRSGALRTRQLLGLVFLLVTVPLMGVHNLVFLVWFPGLLVHLHARQGLALLNGIDHLPLARRRLLPVVALPPALALASACGLLALFPQDYRSYELLSRGLQVDRVREEVLGREGERGVHLRVPPEHWRLASDPEEARVVAPWGEEAEPTRHPLFWGARSFAYDPYDVDEDSSVRFLAWQVSRALRDVHGVERTPEEVHAAWFAEHDLDAPVGETRIGRGDTRPWGRLERSLPNAAGGWVLYGLLVWAASTGYALRANVPRLGRRGAPGLVRLLRRHGVPAASFALLLGVVALSLSDPALLGVLGARAHLAVDRTLGSSALAWVLLDAAVLGLAYAVLRLRIARIEVPPLPRLGLAKKEVPVY